MAEPFTPEEIHEVIARVRRRLGGTEAEAPARPRVPAEIPEAELGEGLYATIDQAVSAAERAFLDYQALGPDGRQRIVDSVRRTMLEHAERLARIAVEETGLGRIDDKLRKILLVTNRTPGPEDLEPIIETGASNWRKPRMVQSIRCSLSSHPMPAASNSWAATRFWRSRWSPS